MIFLKITTADNDYWHTGFNGTLEEAKTYFLDQHFERSDETMGEVVVSVEVVK